MQMRSCIRSVSQAQLPGCAACVCCDQPGPVHSMITTRSQCETTCSTGHASGCAAGTCHGKVIGVKRAGCVWIHACSLGGKCAFTSIASLLQVRALSGGSTRAKVMASLSLWCVTRWAERSERRAAMAAVRHTERPQVPSLTHCSSAQLSESDRKHLKHSADEQQKCNFWSCRDALTQQPSSMTGESVLSVRGTHSRNGI